MGEDGGTQGGFNQAGERHNDRKAADRSAGVSSARKAIGAVCNLDCSYCFFLSKEMLYPGSRFRMADELLETYVRQLIEAHSGVPVVEVAWQGGEPTLMELEFFRRSVELVDHYLQPGQRAAYTIQTNGTKLDGEWAAFLRQHEFLVGISIDGPREVHDTFRVTKGGRGSFDQVMRGLGELRGAGVEFNVLTAVHTAKDERTPLLGGCIRKHDVAAVARPPTAGLSCWQIRCRR